MAAVHGWLIGVLTGVVVGVSVYSAWQVNERVERVERDVVQIASFLNQQIAQAKAQPTPTPRGKTAQEAVNDAQAIMPGGE